MTRNRTRRMSADRLRRHRAGVKRLDEMFGIAGSGPSRPRGDWKRDLLGLLGFDTKASDRR